MQLTMEGAMPGWLLMLVIGALLGVAGTAGIYFVPEEPHKNEIVAAGTIRGALVGLLTGLSMSAQTTILAAGALGLVYGTAFGLVVYLAKGGSAHAPHVVLVSAVGGVVTGLLIYWLVF